jgi:hypothetical protein
MNAIDGYRFRLHSLGYADKSVNPSCGVVGGLTSMFGKRLLYAPTAVTERSFRPFEVIVGFATWRSGPGGSSSIAARRCVRRSTKRENLTRFFLFSFQKSTPPATKRQHPHLISDYIRLEVVFHDWAYLIVNPTVRICRAMDNLLEAPPAKDLIHRARSRHSTAFGSF